MGTHLPCSKGAQPQFSDNVRCCQTAGWTKVPLGMEVGLGPGDFVFDRDPATPRKKAHQSHPIFGPCLLWPNGWIDQDATWYGSRPQRRPNSIRRGPSSPGKGHGSSPSFWPMCIVATVAYLSYCWALVVKPAIFSNLERFGKKKISVDCWTMNQNFHTPDATHVIQCQPRTTV